MKDLSTVKMPPPETEDNGTVRLGYGTPPFPSVRAEPRRVADNGKVRIGYGTPAFPATSGR